MHESFLESTSRHILNSVKLATNATSSHDAKTSNDLIQFGNNLNLSASLARDMPTEREMIYDCIVGKIKTEKRRRAETLSLSRSFRHEIYRVKVFVFGSARRLLYNINLNMRPSTGRRTGRNRK